MRIVSTASGSRPPVSSASPSRSTSVRARRLERAVHRLDAVEPGVDVDVVGLGGHVGPELGAAPLGEDLDPQRRAGRHRRRDGSHDDRHLAGLVRAAGPARPRWSGAFSPGRGPRLGRRRPVPSCRRARAATVTRMPEPRGQPRDVVQRLDDVRRPGRAGLVVGRVGDRDPPDRARGTAGTRASSNTDAIASRQRDCRTSAKSRIDSRSNSSYSSASWCRRRSPSPRPGGRVDDEPVGDLEQLAGGLRPERRLAGPPDGDRQVVDEQRRHERGQVPARLAARGEEDQLGARLRRVRRAAARSGPGSARRSTAARPGPRPGRSASATGGGR